MQLLPHGLYWKRVKSKQTNKQTNKQNRTKQTKQTNKQNKTKQNKTNNIKQLWVRIGYPDT